MSAEPLTARLEEVVKQFDGLDRESRLEVLLEFSEAVPELPPRYAQHSERLERVNECQTPFFAAVELDGGKVRLFFGAPCEAPTTRGFAGILHRALDGASADEVLSVPGDFPARLGLYEALSPRRARGITAILGVIQRQVRERVAADPDGAVVCDQTVASDQI